MVDNNIVFINEQFKKSDMEFELQFCIPRLILPFFIFVFHEKIKMFH